jgi:hypothetical protein
MNINQIKSNIQKGFARPNLFRVSIASVKTQDQPIFRINCYQAQIPGSNLALTDKDTGFRSAAYHRIYSDIILGFYCSEDMKELEYFQNWIDSIVDPTTNRKGYYSSDISDQESNGYTTTITIEQLSRLSSKGGEHNLGQTAPKLGERPIIREKELYEKKGMSYDNKNEVSSRWTLFEAYPRQVDPIQLDYGTNDTVMSMNVTLTYRTFKADFNPFTMDQYPLTKEQKFAREVLGQKTGKEWMRGAVGSAFRGGG